MNVILIHSVRTQAHAKLEPVGVWAVSEEGLRSFYAEGHEHYEKRGAQALLGRPNVSAVEWADYKAATSPNWRHCEPHWGTIYGADSLPAILHGVRAQWAADVSPAAPTRRAGLPMVAQSQAPTVSPKEARINALSWWIAGELTRRHPELIAYESHPGGGMYDVLAVAHPREFSAGSVSTGPQIMMNRVGSIHLRDAAGAESSVSWDQVEHDRLAAAAHLEGVLGYGPVGPASATPRTLGYRFLATALDLFVTDARLWDVRSEFLDTADWPVEDPGHIRAFPSAMAERDLVNPLGIDGEPLSHFFALLRDDEPIAMVSIEGRFHRKSGVPVDLMLAYEKHGRRIRWMTASLLRDWL